MTLLFCNHQDYIKTKKTTLSVMLGFWEIAAGASICQNLWGVQLNNQNFFDEISRILFALFVHRRLCLQCSYVAIAHLMQFFFFSVLSRLGNKRTVFWKKKEKNSSRPKVGW